MIKLRDFNIQESKNDSKKRHVFSLTNSSTTWLLQSTELEMLNWISCISECFIELNSSLIVDQVNSLIFLRSSVNSASPPDKKKKFNIFAIKGKSKSDLATDLVFPGTLFNEIPRIVLDCISEIETRGMNHQGIYRLSGQKSDVTRLKDKYNSGSSIDLSLEPDINVISSLLKLYFRELKEPLFPTEFHVLFINAVSINY